MQFDNTLASLKSYLDLFVKAYKRCALWTETNDDCVPLEDLDIALSENTIKKMTADCEDFVISHWKTLKQLDPEKSGHNFWWTRNEHGTGFWDREELGKIGEELTEACAPYGEQVLYCTKDSIEIL